MQKQMVKTITYQMAITITILMRLRQTEIFPVFELQLNNSNK